MVILVLAGCGSGDAPDGTPEQGASSTAGAPASAAPDVEAVSTSAADGPTGSPADLAAAVADVEADILGVRLAMTPEEVEAALKSNDSITHVFAPGRSTLDPAFSSGMSPINADTPGAFVTGIAASTGPARRRDLSVTFARPPVDNVVESILRKELYSSVGNQQTSLEVYRQTLIDKYGPPTEEDAAGALLLLKWLYPPDAADCTPLKSNLPATKQASSYPDAMGHPPASCATSLIISLTHFNGLVNNAESRLLNVGQEYFNREALIAYRDELNRRTAEEKRQQATRKPAL